MRYIVAYDICQPRRLRRVARICEDYGLRLQKSVFECQLSAPFIKEMMKRLEKEIATEEDSLTSIPICSACNIGRIELGIPLVMEIPDVLVA